MSKVFFGLETIEASHKTEKVQEIFSEVSKNYDLMNDLMSGFQHRLWKQDFVDHFSLKPHLRHLDMATGTGDILKRLVKRLQNNQLPYALTAADLNANMLEVGKARLFDEGIFENIEWCQANAEMLPFSSSMFDSYSIAFGIRNVTNILHALKEAYRCLKPGGAFYCLEFSQPENALFKKAYDLYAFNFIPKIGKFISGNEKAYQYLVESIETFLTPEKFSLLLQEAGFESVSIKKHARGVVCAYTAWKKIDDIC